MIVFFPHYERMPLPSGWSRKLRDNPGWIVTAASKAEQASDYILTGIDINAVA